MVVAITIFKVEEEPPAFTHRLEAVVVVASEGPPAKEANFGGQGYEKGCYVAEVAIEDYEHKVRLITLKV